MNGYAHGREDKIIQAGVLLRDMYGCTRCLYRSFDMEDVILQD